MSITEDVIIIDSDSDDSNIDELRKLAIISMVKHEKVEPFISKIDQEIYPKPFDYKIDCYSSFLPTRKRSCSELSNEGSKRSKLEEIETVNVENIIRESLLEVFDIDNILNSGNIDKAKNLLKEEELKNKLLKILNNKKEVNQSNNQMLGITLPVDKVPFEAPLYESDEDDFDIFTHVCLPPEVITDPNVLKYHNLIAEAKSSIDEIVKSINSMSASIQDKLMKSKKISTQIENLKNQKIELHKEISINRRKILDFNKIKKQKSLELLKYEQLKRKFASNQLPHLSANVELFDSLSTISCETSDSKNSLYDIDCNHIICPLWLNNNCTNKLCVYQHPKFSSKPIKNSAVKIKENDKVFLKEMNPTGFICKLTCEACSENIPIPTLHMTDDWYCKSCCQKLITLKKPTEVLNQLIVIWHHIYKRYIMSKNLSVENRNPSILQNLYKCAEAMKAKLFTVVNLPSDIFKLAGCHVILTLNEESRIDDLLMFIKTLNYNSSLVQFACGLSFSVPKLYQLLIDSIVYQINKSIFDNFYLIIKQFCEIARSVGFPILDQLIQWLESCIRMNVANTHNSVIHILTKMILLEVIGPQFVAHLSLSMYDLQLGDKYWHDRKDVITRLAKLYTTSESLSHKSSLDLPYCSWMNATIHLLLIKYVIFSNFFTGNEEGALELCEEYASQSYFFQVLLSKLSLNYNSPMIFNEHNKLILIEHTYNKSEWLLVNRSIKSSVKLLEAVPQMLYKTPKPIENSKEALNLYESFLEIGSVFDNQTANLVSNINETDMKSVRQSSAIWLCYISLSELTNNLINLDEFIKSDHLFSLPPDHLNRVAQFVITQLSKRYLGSQYCAHLRMILLFSEKSMEFVHFIDFFQCIDFDKLNDCQLQTWLFLIDFCIVRFSKENIDRFLVITSRQLLQNYANCCEVFHHIIMCYPIRVVEVWLNFIQLLLNMDLPLYELIDGCEMAINQFRSSKLLWEHYYACVLKTGDMEMAKKIKENAEKFGFEII